MKNAVDFIEVRANFNARLVEPESKRIVAERTLHNVFTNTGRDWLAHLVAWSTIGTPDVAYTNRRVRWMSVGSGTQLETVGVNVLNTPLLVTAGRYLSALQTSDFPTVRAVRFYKEFSQNEISYLPGQVIPVTEAGLFVDVFPASTAGGSEDSAVGGGFDTTISPAIAANAPVAYATFDAINKTQDFNLEIRWEFRFG